MVVCETSPPRDPPQTAETPLATLSLKSLISLGRFQCLGCNERRPGQPLYTCPRYLQDLQRLYTCQPGTTDH